MHELSIALSLIEVATEALAGRAGRVEAVHLRLGPLSGVVREALDFSFGHATRGTRLAGARLVVEEVPVTVYCGPCAGERELAGIQDFRCPVCGGPTPEVLTGRELELEALEVSDEPG